MSYRDELIEAAARAIYNLTQERWDAAHDHAKGIMLSAAEAALDALLTKLEQPSEAMVHAGVAAWHETEGFLDDEVAASFKAMISHLKGNSND